MPYARVYNSSRSRQSFSRGSYAARRSRRPINSGSSRRSSRLATHPRFTWSSRVHGSSRSRFGRRRNRQLQVSQRLSFPQVTLAQPKSLRTSVHREYPFFCILFNKNLYLYLLHQPGRRASPQDNFQLASRSDRRRRRQLAADASSSDGVQYYPRHFSMVGTFFKKSHKARSASAKMTPQGRYFQRYRQKVTIIA